MSQDREDSGKSGYAMGAEAIVQNKATQAGQRTNNRDRRKGPASKGLW